MLTPAALTDVRNFIKQRIAYAQYRIGSTYYDAQISEVEITSGGIVRVKIPIAHGAPGAINQVRLISTAAAIWASKDVSITLTSSQTHFLQWFDFNISEEEAG